MYRNNTNVILVKNFHDKKKCEIYRIIDVFEYSNNEYIYQIISKNNILFVTENEILPYTTYKNIMFYINLSETTVRIEHIKYFDNTEEYAIIVNSNDFWLMTFSTYDEALNFIEIYNLTRKELVTI